MAHPLEYDDSPEGRIAAEAREIVKWMYEQEERRNPRAEFPNTPDFRDFYDHLRPAIMVELLKAQIGAVEFSIVHLTLLRQKLNEAEFQLAKEKALRAGAR